METRKVNILLSLNLACWLQLETICIFLSLQRIMCMLYYSQIELDCYITSLKCFTKSYIKGKIIRAILSFHIIFNTVNII
jgi:hypothetical protein